MNLRLLAPMISMMDSIAFSKRIGRLRTVQKNLNNIHIWSSVVFEALQQVRSDDEFLNRKTFSVPSTSRSGAKQVARDTEDVKAIIDNALNYEIYYSVLVYLVAQVEAFLNDVIDITLQFDNRRLLTSVQGIDCVKKVDIDVVLESQDKEALISTIIKQQLNQLFYAGPTLQFEYLKKVLDVEINNTLRDEWIELKATRDLIAHNSGVINDVYIKKAGELARGHSGEKIKIDKAYFENAVAKSKSLVGRITSQLQRSVKSAKTTQG